jgi:cell division inhibitor SepF
MPDKERIAVAKWMDKFLGFIGIENADNDAVTEEDPSWEENLPAKAQRGRVVSIHNNRPIKIVISKPLAFEQVQVLADHLKDRRPVIVNLEECDKDTSKRVLDFSSGVIYALNGSLQKERTTSSCLLPAM